LCQRNSLASLAPSVSEPLTIARVGTKCWRGRSDRGKN